MPISNINSSPFEPKNMLPVIKKMVAIALEEDIGDGDLTAQLINSQKNIQAKIIARETAVICGRPWVDEVLQQIDSQLQINWLISDGDTTESQKTILTIEGSARSILTAERSILNFLQFLSGIATHCKFLANLVKHLPVQLLDTRKTIPGMRLAQKYAVKCGGCHNHRFGLFDACLLKENHLISCGGIKSALEQTQNNTQPVEIEVESLIELKEALSAGANFIMLDNFTVNELKKAVKITKNKATLEASGNINAKNLISIAQTGVHCISIGALTKNCTAIDLSMLIENC